MFKKPLRLAIPLLSLCLLTQACAHTNGPTPIIATTPSDATPTFCLAWKKLTYSAKDDSAETAKEIVDLNAARAKLCPEVPPSQ